MAFFRDKEVIVIEGRMKYLKQMFERQQPRFLHVSRNDGSGLAYGVAHSGTTGICYSDEWSPSFCGQGRKLSRHFGERVNVDVPCPMAQSGTDKPKHLFLGGIVLIEF